MRNKIEKQAYDILAFLREKCLKATPGKLHDDRFCFATDSFNAATVTFCDGIEREVSNHYHFGKKDGTIDEWIEELHSLLEYWGEK